MHRIWHAPLIQNRYFLQDKHNFAFYLHRNSISAYFWSSRWTFTMSLLCTQNMRTKFRNMFNFYSRNKNCSEHQSKMLFQLNITCNMYLKFSEVQSTNFDEILLRMHKSGGLNASVTSLVNVSAIIVHARTLINSVA